jgi:hypothetical protein
MEMRAFAVGDVVMQPSGEEVVFDIDNAGALLLIKYSKPSAKEKSEVKSGVAQFRIAELDGILFFLCRFGTGQWMDAPYHPDFSRYTLPVPGDGEGLLLHVMLIDSSTGVLAAQRAIGLSTEFSAALLQTAAGLPPSGDDYKQRIARIYNERTTNDLLSLATTG